MVKPLIIRSCLSSVLACLLVAGIGLPANPALADDTDVTLEATSTEIVTETPGQENPPPSETPPTQIETPSPTTQATTIQSATITNTVTAAPFIRGNYVKDEILARFKDSATDEMIAECLKQVTGEIKSTIDEISVTVIQIDAVNVSNAVATLSACPGVRYVEPNYIATMADTIPTDPGWGLQYGFVNIRAPQGWDLSRGSSSITIAIVDTGVDLGHADLASKIVPGYDFVNNDAIAQDDHGHGTHVAGIAAAVTNNNTGVAGTSWRARIMPVKVLNAAGGGTFADAANGIIWAADNGAQIINLSIGGPTSSVVLQNAVNYADGLGVLVIAATGNNGNTPVLYPAAYPNVIAVGATDSSNNLAGFSNFGAEMDLVAPGVSIYSTSPGGYAYRNGTSMATAFVSGFAAILRGLPGNSAATVRSIMESTALDLGPAGWDAFYGNGLIQMDAAIQLASPNYTPAPEDGNSPVFVPGGYAFTATFTPSITSTSTIQIPLNESQTPTLTPLPMDNSESNDTPTPEIIALDAQSTDEAGSGQSWLIPCCAILLILLGVLLLWFGTKRKWRSYSGIHF